MYAQDLPPAPVEHAPVAAEVPWWVGLPVASVQISAGAGSLPDESLSPLLRSKQGDPFDPQVVRDDLATLFQVGEFSAVEAEVDQWFITDDAGNPEPAVQLVFDVYPAPRIAHVKVSGNRAFSDREVLTASGLGPDQTFFADQAVPQVRRRVQTWLRSKGWPAARVDVKVDDRGGKGLALELVVDEGQPALLDKLTFAGDLDLVFPDGDTRPLTRWARHAGLEEGKPLPPDAITRGQQEIRSQLASMRRPLFGRRRSWTSARVNQAVATVDGQRRVTYTVEPGPQLSLDISGVRSFRADRRVREALAIDDRLRLTRGFLDEADGRMVAALQDRGFLDATADVTLEHVDVHHDVLHVAVEQGPKHKLKHGKWPNRVGAAFVGNEAIPTADLQAVLEQASEDVLRRGYYTPAAMDEALGAARDFYGAHGYQQAELHQSDLEIRFKHGWIWRAVWSPIRWITGALPIREVRPTVTVTEGDRTTLEAAQIAGAADDVDLQALDARLQAMTQSSCEQEKHPPDGCGAFSPQALDTLAHQVVDAHRAAGYLEADARVSHHELGPRQMASTVDVVPGPKVLLRSVVTRGLHQIRPDFVRREVDLHIGDPVTAPDLQRIRDDLYNLGAFRTVQLDLLGDEAARDLVIGVTERAPWSFEAGAGLSTDQGTRLFGRLTRRNLWHVAHRIELQAQIGLDWRSDSVLDWRPDLANPDWRVALTYIAPRFPIRQEDLDIDILLRERMTERTWRMARTGGGIALDHHFGQGLDVHGGVRLETRQLQEVDLGALLPGEPWWLIQQSDPSIPTPWRVQESVEGLAVLDRRDSQLAPTRGFVVSTNGEYSPGLGASWLSEQPTVSFVKADGRVTGYVPLFGFVLRLSAEGGRAIGLGGSVIPLEDRYRLGGTNSLRGFARDTVGPRNLAPRLDVAFPSQIAPIIDYAIRDDASRWVPTGGDATALGVAELDLPWPALGLTAWDGWASAVFADLGNVWLLSPDTTVTSNEPAIADLLPPFRTGVGVGLRVATPVGPLQLDVATNLDAVLSQGELHNLLVNEWEEPYVRAHLTLGALF